MMHGMVIDKEEALRHTLAQVKAFLDGTTEVAFRAPKVARHRFIERVLRRFGYAQHTGQARVCCSAIWSA